MPYNVVQKKNAKAERQAQERENSSLRAREFKAQQRKQARQEHDAYGAQIAASQKKREVNCNADKQNKLSACPQPNYSTAQELLKKEFTNLAAKLGADAARELLTLRARARNRKQNRLFAKNERNVVINPDKTAQKKVDEEKSLQRKQNIAACKVRRINQKKQEHAWKMQANTAKNEDIESRRKRRNDIAASERLTRERSDSERRMTVELRHARRESNYQAKCMAEKQRKAQYMAKTEQLSEYKAQQSLKSKAIEQERRNKVEERKAFGRLYRARAYQSDKLAKANDLNKNTTLLQQQASYRATQYAFRKENGKSHPILKNQLFSKPATNRSANTKGVRASKQMAADVASVRDLPDF